MVGNTDLEKRAGSQDNSVSPDNGDFVKVEEYRKPVNFSDGEYVEICIRRERKGVTIARTYIWEKNN